MTCLSLIAASLCLPFAFSFLFWDAQNKIERDWPRENLYEVPLCSLIYSLCPPRGFLKNSHLFKRILGFQSQTRGTPSLQESLDVCRLFTAFWMQFHAQSFPIPCTEIEQYQVLLTLTPHKTPKLKLSKEININTLILSYTGNF